MANNMSRLEAVTSSFFMVSSLFALQAAPGVSGVWYSSAKPRVNFRVKSIDPDERASGRDA